MRVWLRPPEGVVILRASCLLFGLLGLVVVFLDLEPPYICEGLAKATRGCGYSEG